MYKYMNSFCKNEFKVKSEIDPTLFWDFERPVILIWGFLHSKWDKYIQALAKIHLKLKARAVSMFALLCHRCAVQGWRIVQSLPLGRCWLLISEVEEDSQLQHSQSLQSPPTWWRVVCPSVPHHQSIKKIISDLHSLKFLSLSFIKNLSRIYSLVRIRLRNTFSFSKTYLCVWAVTKNIL